MLTPAFQLQGQSLWQWETLYSGYRWDSESGLFHVRRRVLNPVLGVWLQRDPLGLSAGVNLFAYARDNPIIGVDPLGLFDPGSGATFGGVVLTSTQSAAAGGSGAAGAGGAGVGIGLGGPIAIGVVAVGLLGWLAWESYKLSELEATGRALDAKLLQLQINIEIRQYLKLACKDPLLDLTKKAFKKLQTTLKKGGECEFFLAWCLWGTIELFKTNPWWGRSQDKCWDCYKECKGSRNNTWPKWDCYIGRGPVWSSTDPTKPVWPLP